MNKVTEALIKFSQDEVFGIINTNYKVLKQLTYCRVSNTVKRIWISGSFEEAEICDIPLASIHNNILLLNRAFFTKNEIQDIKNNIQTPFMFVKLGYYSYKLDSKKLSQAIHKKSKIHNRVN